DAAAQLPAARAARRRLCERAPERAQRAARDRGGRLLAAPGPNHQGTRLCKPWPARVLGRRSRRKAAAPASGPGRGRRSLCIRPVLRCAVHDFGQQAAPGVTELGGDLVLSHMQRAVAASLALLFVAGLLGACARLPFRTADPAPPQPAQARGPTRTPATTQESTSTPASTPASPTDAIVGHTWQW